MADNTNITQQSESTGRLCNFEEFVANHGGFSMEIVVPKIQRAYAQGRKREINIREQFVSQILECLSKGEAMELNFVYGAKTSNEHHTTFELLDGQQRLTTLFLLYWYFTMVEGGNQATIPETLKHFSYETRTTSTDFIKKLVNSSIDVSTLKPSASICSRQWYTITFDKDSTVEGMLRMLDTIHDLYNRMGRPSGMLANLSKIRFYELDLMDFGLTEEIYIKMNARGLQLTPFENFKADLVKFMKDERNPNYKEEVEMNIIGRPKAPYYISFSQKLDAQWLNLFWSKNDEDNNVYCDKFFRFFYRYMASKYYLIVKGDASAQEFRPKRDDIWDFLWSTSQKQSSTINKIYLGFTNYQTIFEAHPEFIKNIEIILDVLCTDELQSLFASELSAPWNRNVYRTFFEEEYKLQDAVMFCGITEFIEAAQDDIDLSELKHWIRIIWNTTENQLYQNVNEVVSTARNLSEIIRTKGATKDVYGTLAKLVSRNDYPRSLREEIKKANIIISNPNEDWETAFIEAESHPFFRGAIGYFLFAHQPKSPEEFRHRTSILGKMFDAKGITPKFREEHILIMAMIRQLNSPEKMGLANDGFVSLSITEGYDTLNHLKSVLIEKKAIQDMLCKIGDMRSIEDAISELNHIVKSDVSFNCTINDDNIKGKMHRAFNRLAYDKKLYDFIRDKEDATHIMEFTYLDRQHYAVNKKRSWYCKFFIESEKNLIIPELINKSGYELNDSNQIDSYNEYGDYFGYEVCLKKQVTEHKELRIDFYRGDQIEYFVFEPNEILLQKYPNAKVQDNGWVQLRQMYYQSKEKDLKYIIETIESIEKAIVESESTLG